MVVAVIGASAKQDRYSNRAIHLLREHGHTVIPVVPGHPSIEGLAAVPSPGDLEPGEAHTLTLYVNPTRSSTMAEGIIQAAPQRVIMNPGTENPELADALQAAGIQVQEACTLVLLNTGHFEERVR